jgi:hypothetical protein
MERIMKAQALGRSPFPPKARRVMVLRLSLSLSLSISLDLSAILQPWLTFLQEINPRHPILVELNKQLKEVGGPENAPEKAKVHVLFSFSPSPSF